MTTLKIQIDDDRSAWAAALVASLPASLERSDHPAAVLLMDGAGDWPGRLSDRIGTGRRRFLVVDPAMPSLASLDRVIALVEESGAEVVISETHGGHPAVAPFRGLLDAPHSMVTITGNGTISLTDLALQQLRLARAIGLEGIEVIQTLVSENCLVATLGAVSGDAPLLLRLSLARSHAIAPSHRLTAHAPLQTAIIELDSERDARPAKVIRADRHGQLNLPTIYESAHRAALRSMANEPSSPAHRDLAAWREDARLALAITGK